MTSDSGFTLVEMLVGLLVLSFAAIALSTTLSSAFKSRQRIEASATKMAKYDRLDNVLRDIARSQYIKPNSDKNLIESEILLSNARSLNITEEERGYVLSITEDAMLEKPTTLFESERPIRFKFTNAFPTEGNRSLSRPKSGRNLSVEISRENNWDVLLSVPLISTVAPNCRYDIIGRRCR